MNDFPARLRELRIHLGLSQERFAEIIGVNLRTYRGYEINKRRVPAELLGAIFNATGISARWLLTGKGPLLRNSICESTQTPVPVVGQVKAGPDGSFLPDQVQYYIPRPAGVDDEEAFAFEISGDSMLPRYRPGDVVICSRRAPLRSDDDVVVTLDWGETMCKIWRSLGGRIRLESWNETFRPLEVSADQVLDCVKVVGLVWGSLAQKAKIAVEQ